jgi:hypothetical protein
MSVLFVVFPVGRSGAIEGLLFIYGSSDVKLLTKSGEIKTIPFRGTTTTN